jgi:hypothetical protein
MPVPVPICFSYVCSRTGFNMFHGFRRKKKLQRLRKGGCSRTAGITPSEQSSRVRLPYNKQSKVGLRKGGCSRTAGSPHQNRAVESDSLTINSPRYGYVYVKVAAHVQLESPHQNRVVKSGCLTTNSPRYVYEKVAAHVQLESPHQNRLVGSGSLTTNSPG